MDTQKILTVPLHALDQPANSASTRCRCPGVFIRDSQHLFFPQAALDVDSTIVGIEMLLQMKISSKTDVSTLETMRDNSMLLVKELFGNAFEFVTWAVKGTFRKCISISRLGSNSQHNNFRSLFASHYSPEIAGEPSNQQMTISETPEAHLRALTLQYSRRVAQGVPKLEDRLPRGVSSGGALSALKSIRNTFLR